jgi:general stress protein 26
MGDILAIKHLSKRKSSRFHCWSANCKDYLEQWKRTSNMKMLRIHLQLSEKVRWWTQVNNSTNNEAFLFKNQQANTFL